MKKMMFTLIAMLTIAATANAMSYEQARNEALFLTDKMAYELNLNDAQYEAAYEINLDYLMGVVTVDDLYGTYWERRNLDLSYILFSWQWDLYRAATYFYRPLYWNAGYWHFGIYARYPHRDYFYFGRPHFYASYRGGHSWRMNGGRSYYQGRHDHYRPNNVTRDSHFGMRNGWDRGDYRNNNGHGSSTRVTADQRGSGFGSGRNGSGNVRNDNNNGSRNNSNNHATSEQLGSTRTMGDRTNSTSTYSNSHGSFGGSRSGSMNSSNSRSYDNSSRSGSSTRSYNGTRSYSGTRGYKIDNSSSRSSRSISSQSRQNTYKSSGSMSSSSSSMRSSGSSSMRSSGGSSMRSSGGSSMRSSGSSSRSGSHGSFGGGRHR